MRCTKCGNDSREGAKFCSECAAPFAAKCLRCGAINILTAKFCDECAAPFEAAPGANAAESPPIAVKPDFAIPVTPGQPAESAQIEGERKTVTALFADIKGSTELMRDLDPEVARAMIDPALKLMIDAVHRYDGYVVQSTGDGIFALFGAPIAHEDHPQRALHAAIETRDELQRRGEDLRMQGRPGVAVRIGITTGEVGMRTVQT